MRNRLPAFVLLLVSVLAAASACGVDPPADTPSADEQATYDRGSSGLAALLSAAIVADSMFDFDPTIDPRGTALNNAMNIDFTTRMNLASCGSVTLSGTTITVNFSASWCAVRGGAQVSGAVTANVTKVGTATNVALQFDNVTVNGRPITGTATFSTSDGSTFNVTANLTSGTQSIVIAAPGVTIVGSINAMTASGTFSVSDGAVTTNVTLTSVHWVLGQCYPDSGSVTITRGPITETMTFSSNTPTTGAVTVSRGIRVFQFTLPRLCPGT